MEFLNIVVVAAILVISVWDKLHGGETIVQNIKMHL